jgi:hypothetical protein
VKYPFMILSLTAFSMIIAASSSQGQDINQFRGSSLHKSNSKEQDNFPTYSQPTTRFVTTGNNLRRTRKFGLSQQMNRESLGFIAR